MISVRLLIDSLELNIAQLIYINYFMKTKVFSVTQQQDSATKQLYYGARYHKAAKKLTIAGTVVKKVRKENERASIF